MLQSDTSAPEAEVHRLDEELLARKLCIESQDKELQARQQRIKELEVIQLPCSGAKNPC